MRTLKAILIVAFSLCAAVLGFGQEEAICREIAQRTYPNDPQMQEFIYKQQVAAARFMAYANDNDVKAIALRAYPEDYSMQKFTYEKAQQ